MDDTSGRSLDPAPVAEVIDLDRRRANSVPGRELGLKAALGRVLRSERCDQERTLAEVAGRAGVSLPYLSEVERGRKDVSADVLEAICRSLEVSVPSVLERTAGRLRSHGSVGGSVLALAA